MLGMAAIGLLVLPQGYAAATEPKADWRGAARDIVDIVESNADSSYVIYEPSFRPTPLLDYYLARYSDDVRGNWHYPAVTRAESGGGPAATSLPSSEMRKSSVSSTTSSFRLCTTPPGISP